MHGTLQLGTMSWKMGLFRKSVKRTKKEREIELTTTRKHFSATKGIQGKSREHQKLKQQAEDRTENRWAEVDRGRMQPL